MTDPSMMARAEIEGVGDFWRVGPLKPLLKIFCGQCRGRGALEIGRVYATRQGLVLFALRKRDQLADGRRKSSGALLHLLSTPLPPPPGDDNWVGNCARCGYRRLPDIDTLSLEAGRRKARLFC